MNDSLNDISFHLERNGEAVQSASAANMIFSPQKLIAFVSSYITLRQGDMLFTGTPEGVAQIQKDDVLEGFIGKQKLLSVRVK